MSRSVSIKLDGDYLAMIEELQEHFSRSQTIGRVSKTDVIKYAVKELYQRIESDELPGTNRPGSVTPLPIGQDIKARYGIK